MNLSRRAFLSGTVTGALVLLAACGQAATTTSSKPSGSGAAGAAGGGTTPPDWNSLVVAAKQEGSVVLGLGPGSGPVTRQIRASTATERRKPWRSG